MWKRIVTAVSVVSAGVNLILLVFLLMYAWQLCSWPFACEIHRGPYTFSQQTLSLQISLLQFSLVGVAVGLTLLGVFGYGTIQDRAQQTAKSEAQQTAKSEARKTAESEARKTAEPIASEVAREYIESITQGDGPPESIARPDETDPTDTSLLPPEPRS